jgi:methylenetetrahydrofolate reductase (NADPH)
VDRKKLLQVSLKVGVGDSARFLKKQAGLVGMLLKPGGYSPDELVERLAPYAGDKHYDIAGLHLYTFNQVEGKEQWRQGMLGPKKASGAGAPR